MSDIRHIKIIIQDQDIGKQFEKEVSWIPENFELMHCDIKRRLMSKAFELAYESWLSGERESMSLLSDYRACPDLPTRQAFLFQHCQDMMQRAEREGLL